MKNFSCPTCGNRVYFENMSCIKCGSQLGFDVNKLTLVTMKGTPANTGAQSAPAGNQTSPLNYCANEAYGVCNWLAPADAPGGLCRGCALNRTIPNLTEAGALQAWAALEHAKKRLLYTFLRFGLQFDGGKQGAVPIAFDFVTQSQTGHLNGVITIDIKEADSVERERQRQQFQEPYRTLLGHFRHESGHFFWPTIVAGAGRSDEFRGLFGDERADYNQALNRHHAEGPPSDWQSRFVTSYASAHPWEDWAETWAHYLHMVAVLDTSEAVGMEPRAAGIVLGAAWPFSPHDVYRVETCESLIDRWIALTIALNSLSRAIGHDDFYPFVISDTVRTKLAFVHDTIRAASGASRTRLWDSWRAKLTGVPKT